MARNRRFTVLLTDAEFQRARAAAKIAGVSLSSLVRSLLAHEAAMRRVRAFDESPARNRSPKPEGSTR
jgi:hypothetical protein